MIILTFCRKIERQAPVKRPLCAGVKTCNVLAKNVVEIRIVAISTIVLWTMILRVLIFRAVVKLPLAKLMLLIDIYMPTVYILTVFRAKLIIVILKQWLWTVLRIAGIVAADSHTERCCVTQCYIVVTDGRQHIVGICIVAQRSGWETPALGTGNYLTVISESERFPWGRSKYGIAPVLTDSAHIILNHSSLAII